MRTAEEIVERARDIVHEDLGIEREKLVPEADFRSDLECDSLDMIEVVMAMEKEFDIDINDEDAEKALKSFGAFTDYLTGRLCTESA